MRAHVSLDEAALERLIEFVLERKRVHLLRASGEPKPWTDNEILRTYKFTNVYREHDRVTIWIDEHIRQPWAEHPNLWFMLAAARQINWPDTLADLIRDDSGAWPRDNDWNWKRMAAVLLNRKTVGLQVYTGAYMLTCQPPQLVRDGEKANFTAEIVLNRIWEERAAVEPQLHTTLAAAHAAFKPFHGWGDFLIAQVVADLKHTRYLRNAPDWFSWAILGPGSTRGLNRLFKGRELSANWKPEHAEVALEFVRSRLDEALLKNQLAASDKLCAQDAQNCLCEFDKFERARSGDGRPRALYAGS